MTALPLPTPEEWTWQKPPGKVVPVDPQKDKWSVSAPRHSNDMAQSQSGFPISCRAQVLLKMWPWKFLPPEPHPSCGSAWQSTNTVRVWRIGHRAGQDSPASPALPAGSPVGACPPLVPLGSFLLPDPAPPGSVSPGRQPVVIIKEREAIINRHSLGLQGGS